MADEGDGRARGRRVSQADRDLWLTVVRDAKPLRHRVHAANAATAVARAEEARPAPPAATVATRPPAPRPKTRRSHAHIHLPTRPAKPQPSPYERAGIDKRTDERLSRGLMAIDGTIDLHGMNQAQAHAALVSYLHGAYSVGRRCILVITGKGSYSERGGVLKGQVPRWLVEPNLRPLIVAIRPARPHHGGGGALYVLLRRRRDAG